MHSKTYVTELYNILNSLMTELYIVDEFSQGNDKNLARKYTLISQAFIHVKSLMYKYDALSNHIEVALLRKLESDIAEVDIKHYSKTVLKDDYIGDKYKVLTLVMKEKRYIMEKFLSRLAVTHGITSFNITK